jgi:hypothetical protein
VYFSSELNTASEAKSIRKIYLPAFLLPLLIVRQLRIFFIFSPNLKYILDLTRIYFFLKKTSPFGPATMHGGAIELNPAMHGGEVQVPRDMQRVVNADVAEKREKTYPATHHGGVRLTRHRW